MALCGELQHRVCRSSQRPDRALFCTPRWMLEQGIDALADLHHPLSVVLLESDGESPSRERQSIASLTEFWKAFTVLDVTARTHIIYDAEVASRSVTFRLRQGRISKQRAWLF